jgi:hypothetical protein
MREVYLLREANDGFFFASCKKENKKLKNNHREHRAHRGAPKRARKILISPDFFLRAMRASVCSVLSVVKNIFYPDYPTILLYFLLDQKILKSNLHSLW